MADTDTIYAVRWAGPGVLERTRSNTVQAPVYLADALVAPSAGTYLLERADQTTVVSGSVSIVGSVAQYTVTSTTLAAEDLAETYFETWTLTLSGVSRTFRRDVAICRSMVAPVVTDEDLVGRHADLRDLRPSGLTSYQGYREEAWKEVLSWIRRGGSLPHLVCSPQDLREPHLFGTLALIFRDFALTASNQERWSALADFYEKKAMKARSETSLKYDRYDTGKPDTDRRPATAVTVLGAGQTDPYPMGRMPVPWVR